MSADRFTAKAVIAGMGLMLGFVPVQAQAPAQPAPVRTKPEYWEVATTPDFDIVDFVDAASITGDTAGFRQAAIAEYYASRNKQFPEMHATLLQEYNCATRQVRALQVTLYDKSGNPDPRYGSNIPGRWSFADPNSLAAGGFAFVCEPSLTERAKHAAKLTVPPERAAREHFSATIMMARRPPVEEPKPVTAAPTDYQQYIQKLNSYNACLMSGPGGPSGCGLEPAPPAP